MNLGWNGDYGSESFERYAASLGSMDGFDIYLFIQYALTQWAISFRLRT